MSAKELADLEVLHRNYERIAAADAASHQKCFDYYEQKQREEQAKKFDLHLRIGVFFDGTGNFHRRFYMDGIGTVRGDEDSWIGLGTGRGEK